MRLTISKAVSECELTYTQTHLSPNPFMLHNPLWSCKLNDVRGARCKVGANYFQEDVCRGAVLYESGSGLIFLSSKKWKGIHLGSSFVEMGANRRTVEGVHRNKLSENLNIGNRQQDV